MSIAPVSLGTISDVMPSGINVPPIDYTSRDYTSLVNDMLVLIPSYMPEWTDRSPGDFGIVLIELFAYVGDIINFYSDRIANEAYLATAQQRQSVLNIAALLDYTPHGNVAATTQLQFSISAPSAPVRVPAHATQVATPSFGIVPVIFETTEDLWIFGDGVSPPPISATGTGTPFQEVALITADPNPPNTPWYNFDGGGINEVVTVNGTPWTFVSDLTGAGNSYTVVGGTAPYIIQFGDGTNGNMPLLGDAILVTYQPAPPGMYQGQVEGLNGSSTLGETLGVSDGTPQQQFTLFNTPVVDGSEVVYVDQGLGPQPWTYFPHIADAFSNDQAYTLSTDGNGVVSVIFGDNVNGLVPITGSTITADYLVGGGSIGNVAANTLTLMQSGPSAIIAVTNPTAATGGADTESVDHIRVHAPLSITAINRAVTLDDYAALALNVPGVGKASAQSTAYNAVSLYIHPAGDFFGVNNDYATTVSALNEAVSALAPTITNSSYTGYLDTKKMVTTSIVVVPPLYNNNGMTTTGYVPCKVTATVQVLPQYQNSAVQSAVTSALKNLFLFSVVDFGYRVSLSSVYHAVMNVEGVDYVNITQLCRGEAPSGTLGDIVCAVYEIPQLNPNGIAITATGGLNY